MRHPYLDVGNRYSLQALVQRAAVTVTRGFGWSAMAVQELGVISIVTASPMISGLLPLPAEDGARGLDSLAMVVGMLVVA